MRVINKINIVTHDGVKSYGLGDKVNGLERKQIADISLEYENSIEIGYRCLSVVSGAALSDTVVEIWNAPVVVEYREVTE